MPRTSRSNPGAVLVDKDYEARIAAIRIGKSAALQLATSVARGEVVDVDAARVFDMDTSPAPKKPKRTKLVAKKALAKKQASEKKKATSKSTAKTSYLHYGSKSKIAKKLLGRM